MKGRVILAVVVGLLILAVVVFYVKVGGLKPGREDFDRKRMGYCFDVATDQTGSRLFLAAGYRGLHILDVTQGQLKYVSTCYDDGYYRNLKVWKDRAYIADSKRGLVVLDISGETPVTTWVQSSGKAYGIYVEDDRAYVAAHGEGLEIFDISNPDSPVLLSTLQTGGYAWDVWEHDEFAYVADVDRGVSVFDVSAPAEPRRVGFVTWAQHHPVAEIVRGEGNVIYIAAADHGLIVIDISDPAHPVVASTYRPVYTGAAEGLAVRDGIVYLAVGSNIKLEIQGEIIWEVFTIENGLHMVDTTNPYSPSLISKINFLDWVEGVHVAGDFVYVANTGTGVRSIDIRDLEEPVLLDIFNLFP